MKMFKVFSLVCLFFFLVGCDDGVTRFVPVDETDDGSSEITDDADNPDTTPDPADTENPDTTPDPTDTGADTTDTGTDTTDTGADTTDTGTDTTDTGTDTTDTGTDTTDTGTDTTDTGSDTTDSGTDTCYSAAFNGNDSKIEVAHNNLLNLKLDAWTIEAWIKQLSVADSDDPLVGKKNNNSYTYFLSPYYTKTSSGWGQQQTTTAMKASASYGLLGTVSAEATNISNSGNWTHVAMVQTMSGSLLKKPQIALYINGTKVKESENNSQSNSVSISTSNDVLLIGKSFNGSIDSVRISNTAKYSNTFSPAQLGVEIDTIAFWDFTNNTNDASINGLNGTATNVTFENDCAGK